MRIPLLVLIALPLYAQSVSVGGKIGVPFNDPMGPGGNSRPVLFGPTVEVSLPGGFAVEGSALYRRMGRSTSYLYGPPETPSWLAYSQRGDSWEFPLVAKYYFRDRKTTKWQPFFGTGWTMRTINWHYEGSSNTTNTSGQQVSVPIKYSNREGLNVGATFSAGARIPVGRFSILPEFRYTRWGAGDGTVRRNEGGFVLGFRF